MSASSPASGSDQAPRAVPEPDHPSPNPNRAPHPLVTAVLRANPPISDLIGFRVDDIGSGRAVATLRARPQHANPMGTLHGGVLCDVADAAMSMAFVSTLGADESFTTMALSMHYFRPVWEATLRVEAQLVHRGRDVGLIECDIRDEAQRLVARGSATCMVLRGERGALARRRVDEQQRPETEGGEHA